MVYWPFEGLVIHAIHMSVKDRTFEETMDQQSMPVSSQQLTLLKGYVGKYSIINT